MKKLPKKAKTRTSSRRVAPHMASTSAEPPATAPPATTNDPSPLPVWRRSHQQQQAALPAISEARSNLPAINESRSMRAVTMVATQRRRGRASAPVPESVYAWLFSTAYVDNAPAKIQLVCVVRTPKFRFRRVRARGWQQCQTLCPLIETLAFTSSIRFIMRGHVTTPPRSWLPSRHSPSIVTAL